MRASRILTLLHFARTVLAILFLVALHGDDGDTTEFKWQLLSDLYDPRDFAGGRLTGMPYRAVSASAADPGAIRWFLEGADPDSVSGRHSNALFAAVSGQLERAEEILTRLALELPKHASIQNDLGVVLMARAEVEPLAWFRAIQQFKLALAAQPELAEPKYNLILTYRHLRVHKRETAAAAAYSAAGARSAWDIALDESASPALDLVSFAAHVAAAEPTDITGIVQAHPEFSRKIVLDYASSPMGPVPANYQRIAEELGGRYGDQTAVFALAPLETKERHSVSLARRMVRDGRDLYLRARLRESGQAYTEAEAYAERTKSVFDQLWVDVHRADTLIRMAEYSRASAILRHVIEVSREHKLTWLQARALSILGSAPDLSDRLLDSLSALGQAIELYSQIGEVKESARPLYYQAAYNHIAGSLERSLYWALKSLNAADAADHIRLAQVYALVSVTLFRMGYSELALEFNEEALDHAQKAANPDLIAAMKIELASHYVLRNQLRDALQEIDSATASIQEITSEAARNLRKVSLNLTAARIRIASGDPDRAEQLLRSNMESSPGNPAIVRTNHVRSQSLLLLSKTLLAQGRTTEAGQELLRAVSLAESDQDYLASMDLQVAFDEERRQLYEAAIDFEFNRLGCDAPWKLLQAYKAKLFLGLLGRVKSAAKLPSGRALTVSDVQQRIPEGVQIADYALLGDRLLIWVVSKERFECRFVPIRRYELERSVMSFLKLLRTLENVEHLSRELFRIVGEPIMDLLDSRRVLVIIPDGILHRLPFSALRSAVDGRYWIEHMPIMQSPSIGYMLSVEKISSSSRRYAAFGSRTYDVLIHDELMNLHRIYPEISIHTGSAVTKAAFLRAIRENNVLYYAGHSAFDVRAPLQSSIFLDGDKQGANTVYALDILEQRSVRNGIVVLSSCETSLGDSTDGPGIRGLTSAFLVAGAGAVVGSIWPVESASTGQLMSLTFEHLMRSGMSISESLQRAQMQLMHSATSHPYYWSGFVVTGNLSALDKIVG